MSDLRTQADLVGVALDADFVVPPLREMDERSLVVPASAWLSPGSPAGEGAGGSYPGIRWEVEGATLRRASPDCLDSFIRLDSHGQEGGDFAQRALAFLQAFGPLGICEHGRPFRHDSWCTPGWARIDPTDPRLSTEEGVPVPAYPIQGLWEPITAWQAAGEHLRAMLSAGVDLTAGHEVSAEDRLELWPASRPRGLWRERQALADELKLWLRYGAVAPAPSWESVAVGEPLKLRFHYVGLIGVLVMQLAAALASPQGLFKCVGCGRPYTPEEGKRRPSTNRRAWCGRTPDCDRRAQSRDYRKRSGRRR